MVMPRFFTPLALSTNQTIELDKELTHYALRVLRLKTDTGITLFNGQGGEYSATLIIDGKKALAQIGEHYATEIELAGDITLIQGIPSGDKMDWVVEKAVELGAKRLVPITAQRSVIQLSGERLSKRQRHWERIALSASEQCGRNQIMQIDAPTTLPSYLAQSDLTEYQTLLCHPEAEHTLSQTLQPNINKIALLVGPEGGWSREEQALVKRHSVTPIRFGNRVLRTETAGLALIAAVCALQQWD